MLNKVIFFSILIVYNFIILNEPKRNFINSLFSWENIFLIHNTIKIYKNRKLMLNKILKKYKHVTLF